MNKTRSKKGPRTVRLTKPIDTHLHLRVLPLLMALVKHLGKYWAAILPMPNTKPPITTGRKAVAYAKMIREAGFYGRIIGTIKLTKRTTIVTIRRAAKLGVLAAKFYPKGLTTNAEDGFGPSFFARLDPIYAEMERVGMHLLMHGEMPGYSNRRREIAFLKELERIARKFPRLKITLEHVTTKEAVACVKRLYDELGNVSATITAHHLFLTEDHIFDGWPDGPRGLCPHHFCKPVAKAEEDRQALVEAVLSGHSAFRYGSDSAPHLKKDKEKDCGCAGVYTAPVAIPFLVQFFEHHGKLRARWDGFMFHHANRWFNLGLEPETLVVEKKSWVVPQKYHGVVPFLAGRRLKWRLK